jgi:hypothetical protein
MAGKPVTVGSLKEIVERADVKGAVGRANAAIVNPLNCIFRIILKIVGLAFIVFGLSVIFGLVAAESYILVHSGPLIQNNIFPVGIRERILLGTAMIVVGLIALFIMFFGVAIFRRRWPIRSWVTGILIGLILIGIAVGGALSADVYSNVRARYNSNIHTTVRSTQPFTAIDVNAIDNLNINFATSTKYYISFNYYGHPNLGSIHTSVVNGTLAIDASQFKWQRNCTAICIPNTYNLSVTVYSPNALQLINQFGASIPTPSIPFPQKAMYIP